ncbi:hypothetical protein CALCODRAFT_513627, partial [Calocera cornea HHB12733]
ALRARSAAGGVIRVATLNQPLSLGNIPEGWVNQDLIPMLEEEFYSRSDEPAPLVGPAVDMALSFGVSRPLKLLGAYTDGFNSYWISATPTPKGNRYFAFAVANDDEEDPHQKAPATFRYSDVEAAHALELVTRDIGASQFKALHPDATYIASALEQDILLVSKARADAATRSAAALRLGLTKAR